VSDVANDPIRELAELGLFLARMEPHDTADVCRGSKERCARVELSVPGSPRQVTYGSVGT
jgi:hypothetical protein